MVEENCPDKVYEIFLVAGSFNIFKSSRIEMIESEQLSSRPFFLPSMVQIMLNILYYNVCTLIYGVDFFFSLRKVDLSDNKIVNFPAPVLWRSQMLQEIKLSRNRIIKVNISFYTYIFMYRRIHINY